MLRRLIALFVLLLVALPPLPALAQQEGDSRIIYQRKAWQVRVVSFADASVSCAAQVDKPGSSFAIWADGINPIQLQFYSAAWQLGEGSSDVVVRIDRRAPWNLYNAELYQQSVLFRLPNDDDGYRFLREVMRGNAIALSNDRGLVVDQWTLAGSSASINALTQCVDMIRLQAPGTAGNPFQ